ncbi:CD226 antigen isoform X2 [Pleurodeles waltl]|uniref:CD226 antigen isoform X2 n=1 Tax=Pleurodeles waltl TaxID=8319 RepID=UPI003709506A
MSDRAREFAHLFEEKPAFPKRRKQASKKVWHICAFSTKSCSTPSKMDSLAILLTVFHLYNTAAEGAIVDETVKLTAKMTLNCTYQGTSVVTHVIWAKNSGLVKESIAVFNTRHGVHVPEIYKDRIGFAKTDKDSKDKSLLFSDTLFSDLGTYTCSVHTFPEGIWEKTIQVIQADHLEGFTPSSFTYAATLGQNASFSCACTLGDSVKQITWEKLREEAQTTVALCSLSKGLVLKHYGVDHRHRSLVVCNGLQNSTLTIWNVVASDEGIYRCHFATNKVNQTILISLNISSGSSHSSNIIFVFGSAAALTVLMIIILISIIVTCLKKKKKARETKRRMAKSKPRPPNQTRVRRLF